MALFQFKSKGVTRKLVDLVYPVGSLYMSTNSTNPSTLFGGTWEPYAQGRTIIGAGTGNDGSTSMSFTAFQTGGKYKVTLTIAQLASHFHNVRHLASDQTFVNGPFEGQKAWTIGDGGYGDDSQSTGGDEAHENMMPYIATYIWRRTN